MDYHIKVWNLETGEEIASRQAHKLPVHTVAVHPSKPLVASSGWDGWVHLWSLDGLRKLKSVKAASSGSRIIGLDFSPDGELLGLASSDGRAYLWSMGDAPPQSLSGHRGELNLIRFHPTGQSIITSSDDKTVRMWDIQKRALRWFGLVIVPGDGWILTHRGWSNVNRAYTSDNPSKTGWGKSLQNAQHADVSEKTACAVDSEGRLTVWDRDLDRSSPGILTQSVNAVQATSLGCFIRGNGHSQFYDRSGEKVVLPSSGVLRAIGVSERRIFVATDRYITGFDAQNQIVERYIAEPGIRAISLLEGWVLRPDSWFLVSDGGVELRTTKKNGLEATLRLQQTPSSQRVKLNKDPPAQLL